MGGFDSAKRKVLIAKVWNRPFGFAQGRLFGDGGGGPPLLGGLNIGVAGG